MKRLKMIVRILYLLFPVMFTGLMGALICLNQVEHVRGFHYYLAGGFLALNALGVITLMLVNFKLSDCLKRLKEVKRNSNLKNDFIEL